MGSAVRFDAATKRLNRTTGVLSFDANYSVLAWVRITTHPGAGNGACILSVDDQSANVDECYISGNGATNLSLGIVTLTGGSGAADVATATFLAGTWQHVAFVRSANNLRVGYRNGVAEVTHTRSLSGRTAPTSMSVGSVLDSDLFNGRIAHMLLYRAALTVPEILRQMYTVQPVRTADLYGWYPTLPGAGNRGRDWSGNGNHFSEVGTLSDEEGPPVAWRKQLWVIPFLVASGAPVAGDGTATIGDIAATGAGSVAIGGAGAATIGAVEAAGSGTLGAAVTGSGAATLGGLTAAGSGSVSANGAGAATLGALAAAAAGSAAIVGTGAATFGGIAATGKAYVLVGACVAGVLTVDPTNPRYFRDDTGIVILAGSHTWHEFQDSGATYPPDPFDYEAWLDFIDSFGHNYHKIWHMETAFRWPSAERYFTPNVWQRTGPGNAADGLPKFDLDKFNELYFERLRERVILAGNRGHRVVVQFFQGWHIEIKNGGPYQPFACHPMQAGNNINGIDGDTDNDGAGEETRDESIPAITAYQRAYVRKVIDTLNDLDNVLWEISNEDTAGSVTWQHNLVDYIHTYEAGLPKQHPVGMTVLYPSGDNADLFSSNAEWVSPNGSLSAPAATDGSKVVLWDIDHITGTTSDYLWVWRAFCRGNNLAYMDEYIGYAGGNDTTDATHDKIRANLGRVLVHAAQLDLAHATPQNSLASTGFCLAKTAAPAQLVAYQDGAGAFTVNLTSLPGTFSLEWLRPSTGATQAGSDVSGGAVRTLTPPWGDDAVAFLMLAGYSGTGTATIGDLSASGAASAAVNGAGAATIGAVVAVAAAVIDVAGAGQAVVGALVAAAVGSVAVNGTGAAVVGAVTAAAAAAAAINGDATAMVGALEAAGAGTTSSGSVSGGAAAVIGDIVVAGAGSVAVNGAAAAAVGAIVAAGVVVVAVNGAAAAVVGAIEASGFGGSGAGGAATATIGDIAASGAGSVAVNGAGLATIGALVATGASSVAVNGDGSAVIGAIMASGAGTSTDLPEIHGSGAATIGAITADGIGIVAWVLAIARVSGPGVPGVVSGPKSSIGE